MSYINNTGDYLETLFQFVSNAVTSNAEVTYDDEKLPLKKPLIILESPQIVETSFANDGRQQDELAVSILVKVPKSIDKPNIEALNIGGFLRGVIVNETFSGFLDEDHDCVDYALDIQGQPIKWGRSDKSSDANLFGYEIVFSQVVRYGTVEVEPFVLNRIGIAESDKSESNVYEKGDS
ncbi:hypothetical protein BCS71_25665 [Vibrio lentus]|uniref:Uncharacterized protein n=1 Tax=Vibrio tasmaniensis TaxID=212663 RepID=A0A0H3ZYQ3_9VIBR|nr:hypothetical protein [Vibrio lentus]AKN39732.1 hypothetical protein [Vibrio tasmaniensis]PMI58300.1 hypothetical protein BCU41_03970 [Vibrio lentus]